MSYSHDHETTQDLSGRTGFGPGGSTPALEHTGRGGRRPRRPSDPEARSRGSNRGRPRGFRTPSRAHRGRGPQARPRRRMGSRGGKVSRGRRQLTLLDANALLAFLRAQPAEKEVALLLHRGDCATPSPCLAEIVDRLIRRWGSSPEQVAEQLGPLVDESVSVLALDSEIAWRAGEIRAARYHRKTSALSLADCVLLATAGPEDEIATSDRAIAKTARKLGIDVVPLPDSRGRRPGVE
jgi:predicted nucleic acid-binding protein